MPDQELAYRNDKALVWQASGFDRHGRHKRSAVSVELDVRWDDTQSEALDPQGNTITVDATVIVDRAVAIGSIMWHGGIDDLETLLPGTGTWSDVPLSGLMEVVTFNAVPDIKGRATYRECGLKRYTDTMPEVV